MRCVVGMDPVLLSDARALQQQVAELAEFVARQNRYLIRTLGRRRIPPLYDSGIVYRTDPWDPGFQHFPDCLTALKRGYIDCKGAVPYRLADLREEFPDQHFYVHVYPRRFRGATTLHLQVGKPNGEIEDPSRLLHQ